MKQLQTPLSQAELEELDAFLDSDIATEDGFGLDELHGFLTAMACSLNVVMPSQWFPVIWQDQEGPAFESQEQASRVMILITRLYNGINNGLMAQEFTPLYTQNQLPNGQSQVVPDGWCWGFKKGMVLDPEGWTSNLSQLEDALAPIILLSRVVDDIEELNSEMLTAIEDPENVARIAEMIPQQIQTIHDHMQRQRMEKYAATPIQRKGEKVGRNDPCPCGSGKKYKKCCGVPTLH
jgi:uncharacterized protein